MYICKYNYLHSSADAADSPIFAMRNPAASTVIVCIKKVHILVASDVTTATATRQGYGFSRYTVADPTGSGATSPPRIKITTKDPTTSVIADANIKYGTTNVLTLTSAVFEGNFHEVFINDANGSTVEQVIRFDDLWDFGKQRVRGFILQPGEGFVIRSTVAIGAVKGTHVSGSIWWEEFTI